MSSSQWPWEQFKLFVLEIFTVIDWLWLLTAAGFNSLSCVFWWFAGYTLPLCHHLVPVVSLCVSGNKAGREPETQHPLWWGGRPTLPLSDPLMQTAQNKPTLERRKTWNVCSDSLSQDVHFLWGCAMCGGWFMFGPVRCIMEPSGRSPQLPGWARHQSSSTRLWLMCCCC